MAQKLTIYRLLTNSQTTASPESLVKFDGTTLADGKYNHVIDYKTTMSLVAQENPLITKLISEGYTGRKGKGGFYRINKES